MLQERHATSHVTVRPTIPRGAGQAHETMLGNDAELEGVGDIANSDRHPATRRSDELSNRRDMSHRNGFGMGERCICGEAAEALKVPCHARA